MTRWLMLFMTICVWSNAKAQDLSLFQLPPEHKNAIEKVLNKYHEECSETFNGSPTRVIYTAENFAVFMLNQGDTPVTTIEASFECPRFGFPWSGSAGSPTYLIIEGRIFETVRGYPYFLDISDEITVINLWHGGNTCKAHDGSPYSNSQPCFTSLYWNNELKVLVNQGSSIQIIEIMD